MIALFLATAVLAADDKDGVEFFEKRIRPVLIEKCYRCHSTQAEKVKGGLLLDTRTSLLKGGDSGPAVVPGDPEKSILIKAIRQLDKELAMPPKDKEKLTPEQVSDFIAWVRMGAPDPRTGAAAAARKKIDFGEARKFWAFRPLVEKEPPSVTFEGYVSNDVDRFILARLDEKGLRPAPLADKRALLRRVTFDLTGLPPAPEDVEAFLLDATPGAFAKVVDRLLASPHYGERWGRHWLDLVRYADTANNIGYDFPVTQAWRYRNYVINAFNRDTPYDRFLREQIAGDLLPSSNEEERYQGIIATGFLALANRFSGEHLVIEDMIETLGRTTLGLGLSCARCHDHKFDPIPTEDYYALYGIFSSVKVPYAGDMDKPYPIGTVPLLPKDEADAILKPHQEKMQALEKEQERLAKEREKIVQEGKSPKEIDAELERVKKEHTKLVDNRPRVEDAWAAVETSAQNARVQRKGDPGNLGDEVPRGFLQVLGGQRLPAEVKSSGRRELADWLLAHPLTPRVMVNRIWQRHFGKGLVQTPNDFGTRGKPPTHPELLDHLTRRLVESGWSVKEMHRLILLSQTYRRAAADVPENAQADPNNDLYWKFDRRRLEAEEVRDATLAVSGELDRTMGGAHAFPPEKDWRSFFPFQAVYETRRRSVYLMQQRTIRHPFLELFDGADPKATTAERRTTLTPLQALFALNDAFAHRQAERFADRVLADRPEDRQRIKLAYLTAFGRPPSTADVEADLKYLAEVREKLKATSVPPKEHVRASWASYARLLLGSNEFIFLD